MTRFQKLTPLPKQKKINSLCPHLQFIAPHFDKYVAASRQVMACLARFDPRFEAAGLDEAFVDVTEFVTERQKENEGFSALDAANEIRAAVRAATSLPCSAGLAPNRMLAKIASDLAKPDGAFEVPSSPPSALAAWVSATSVRKVPGVGRVTERILDGALGVKTCAQLYENRGLVFCLFGPATAEFLLAASLGAGSDEHSIADGESEFQQRKGLSAERTFSPTSDLHFIDAKLSEIAERVAEGVKAEGLRPKTLTLKVKLATFEVVTRAVSAGGGGGSSNSDPAVSSLCAGLSSFSDAGRIAAVAAALFRAECFHFSSLSPSTAATAAASPAKEKEKEKEKEKGKEKEKIKRSSDPPPPPPPPPSSPSPSCPPPRHPPLELGERGRPCRARPKEARRRSGCGGQSGAAQQGSGRRRRRHRGRGRGCSSRVVRCRRRRDGKQDLLLSGDVDLLPLHLRRDAQLLPPLRRLRHAARRDGLWKPAGGGGGRGGEGRRSRGGSLLVVVQ